MNDENTVDDDRNDEVEVILVVVRLKGKFLWYRSPLDYWVLDLNRWRDDIRRAGFAPPEPNSAERFGIPVVNEITAEAFLGRMQEFAVASNDLAKSLAARFPSAGSFWDVSDLFPTVFVDFDNRYLAAFYLSGPPLERFAPPGWRGEFEDFVTEYPERFFPKSEKYWVQNGVDLLAVLNERGRRIDQERWRRGSR